MRVILLGVVVLAACHNEHHIEVSWGVSRYVAGLEGGEPIGCPEGWDLARVVAVDPAHPEPHVESFPCADGFAVTDYLPADSYIGHIEITTADGAKVLVASPPQVVDVTPFNPYLTATFFVDAGYIDVDWSPCSNSTSADAVLAITPIAPSRVDFTEDDTLMPCAVGHLQAGPYPVGMYTPAFGFDDVQQLAPVAVEALQVTHLGILQ